MARRTHMRLVTVVVTALVGAPELSASPASAVMFRGQITDALERPDDPSRDITNVSTRFDNATGRWTVSVTFAAAPSDTTSARLYLGLIPPRSQCPLGAGSLFTQAETGGSLTRYVQTCRPTNAAFPVAARSVSAGGRRLTYDVTDPATIGLLPGRLNQTRLSKGTIFDMVRGTTLFAPTAPSTIRVGPQARLRVAPSGKLFLPLTGVSRRARARIRLTTTTGATLARRTLTVRPGLSSIRLRLTAAARRRVGRHGTRAVLRSTLTDPTGDKRTISQKLTIIK